MKNLKTFLLCAGLVLCSALSFAQSKMNWQQQKDFHKVMSQTFHPAEEGNLAPIKSRSGEMVRAAEAWKNSTIPADIPNKAEVKKSLKELVKGSRKLDKNVKRGVSDAELTTQLAGLHDTFHTIVGLCNASDKHDHEH